MEQFPIVQKAKRGLKAFGYVKRIIEFLFQGGSFLHIYYTIKSQKNQDLFFCFRML